MSGACLRSWGLSFSSSLAAPSVNFLDTSPAATPSTTCAPPTIPAGTKPPLCWIIATSPTAPKKPRRPFIKPTPSFVFLNLIQGCSTVTFAGPCRQSTLNWLTSMTFPSALIVMGGDTWKVASWMVTNRSGSEFSRALTRTVMLVPLVTSTLPPS